MDMATAAMIVELASIRLAEGKTEADLIAASTRFQSAFLERQPGFLRRELMKKADGTYVDVIHWRSKAEADAVMDVAQNAPAAHDYFSVMDFNPENLTEGVEHWRSLAVYDLPAK